MAERSSKTNDVGQAGVAEPDAASIQGADPAAAGQAEVPAGADGPRTLQALGEAVASAQAEVDAAIRRRDAARDAYDREAEAQAAHAFEPPGQVITAYLAAQNAVREAQIAQAKKQAAR
ncbi:hypothetical protein [Methylobacterium fujisawaense]|uniref:hypothetical protein n=1 Tax=Methylobacterium fujisawaense TaxID=107400 RepID=UPI00244C9DD8|nr:hypothetical protein [Methylobacterium fujisawaense]MDH3027634.1 hypothetical protein [Methylobacterium fujisawaense]